MRGAAAAEPGAPGGSGWPVDDAGLARLAAAGDRAAWAAIYDRYADRLHDYCWSILRDRHEAEDTLHDAFVSAAAKIGQLRDPALLRPWLYSICRNLALALARTGRRAREVPSEDMAAVAPPVTDEYGHEVAQLRQLVWDAAGGLAPRDRAVLELHLRHGLDGRQLAEALGTNPHHATVLLGRVREHVARSLGALLVGRTGRGRCTELDGMLAGWDGELSPLLRKRVARHIDRCAVCGEQRRRVVSPLALLSGVPLLPAPQYLRGRVPGDVAPLTGAGATGPAAPGSDEGAGHPAGGGRWPRDGRLAVVAGAAVLTLLAVLGAMVFAGDTPGRPDAAGSSRPVTAGSAVAAGPPGSAGPGQAAPPAGTAGGTAGGTAASRRPPATTAGVGPASVQVLTPAIDLGSVATEGVLRFRNSGRLALPWSLAASHRALGVHPADGSLPPGATAEVAVRLDRAALPEGAFAARLRLSTAGGTGGTAGEAAVVPVTAVQLPPPGVAGVSATLSWLVPGRPCDRTAVVAAVSGDAPVAVTLHWGPTGGPFTAVAMSGSAGRYAATLGPVFTAGSLRWWVSLTDRRGNASGSAEQAIEVRTPGRFCP